MALRNLAQLTEDWTWLAERYGEPTARTVAELDGQLARYDDPAARMFALGEWERIWRLAQNDFARTRLRAAAIWRLRRQLLDEQS